MTKSSTSAAGLARSVRAEQVKVHGAQLAGEIRLLGMNRASQRTCVASVMSRSSCSLTRLGLFLGVVDANLGWEVPQNE